MDVQRGYRAYVTREWRNEAKQVEHVLQGATGKIWLKPEFRAACKPAWTGLRRKGNKTLSADFKLAREHILNGIVLPCTVCGRVNCGSNRNAASCRCGIYVARKPEDALFTAVTYHVGRRQWLDGVEAEAERPNSTRVLASCVMWGATAEYEKGWRAEQVRIEHLWLEEFVPMIAEELSRRYQCEVGKLSEMEGIMKR